MKHTSETLYISMLIHTFNRTLIIAFIFCVTGAYAQQPSLDDTLGKVYSVSLAKTYPVQNENFLDELKANTSERKLFRYYESHYKAVFKGLNESIKEGELVYVPEMSALLEKIVRRIIEKNPSELKEVNVYLLRENQPNAFTMGDSSLFIHIGLFCYLQNEDQVAGIVAHEIGHLLLRHSLITLAYNYNEEKNSGKDVRSVRHIELKKTDYAFQLLRGYIYNGKKISREHESQADSLGYVLIKNTGYSRKAYVKALELIDPQDSTIHDSLAVETYKKFFSIPGQPFKDKWLKAEDFSSYNYEGYTSKFDKDSLLSHPETEDRVKYLENIFPELAGPETAADTQASAAFKKAKHIAETLRMPNMYFNEQYGKAMYLSLLNLQKDPGDLFYKKWLGKTLRKLYEARRDYQLNKYLDRVSPDSQTESYITFLNFMWNLNLDELKKISDYYSAEG